MSFPCNKGQVSTPILSPLVVDARDIRQKVLGIECIVRLRIVDIGILKR